jgi:hypothetical protein
MRHGIPSWTLRRSNGIVRDMTADSSPSPRKSTHEELLTEYGYLIGGDALWRLLAYPSHVAFNKAVARGRVPVELLKIEGRKSRYARTSDVARWIDQHQFCRRKEDESS